MKISVVMTSFNSEKFISDQLASIIASDYLIDEIIIFDDCSSDSTTNIIRSFEHAKIKLFVNDSNIGANLNFEKCLYEAKGDIIFISDSDNVWLKDKISKTLPIFNDERVGLVMHDAIVVDETLNVLNDSYFSLRKSKPGLLRNIIKNGYGGSMMAFRSSLLKYILPFPKDMPFFFDEWVGMMCARHSKCVFIHDKLSLWRRHSGTASCNNLVLDKSSNSKTKKHCFLKFRIIKIIIDRAKKIRLAFSR